MVRIVPDSLRVLPNTLTPALDLTVEDSVPNDSVLIDVQGAVYSEDLRFITTLHPVYTERLNPPNQRYLAIKSVALAEPRTNTVTVADLIFQLDRDSLSKIEELRNKNPKRDVVFKFDITITYMAHNIFAGSPSPASPGQIAPYSIRINNLVAPDLSKVIQFTTSVLEKQAYVISSSDWVHDFQKPLGIGDYLVFEVPKPDEMKINQMSSSKEYELLAQRLGASIVALHEMEADLRQGEWGRVVEKGRNLIEPMKKDVTSTIKQLISATTNLEEDKAGSLTQAITSLYEYSSDLHHRVGRKGEIKKVYSGGKEDAIMMYALCSSLVNLLSSKLKNLYP